MANASMRATMASCIKRDSALAYLVRRTMKSQLNLLLGIFLSTHFGSEALLQAQPLSHRVGMPSVENTLRFPLVGQPPSGARPFFDIYPVDLSFDLVDWAPPDSPPAFLVRTNAATNDFYFTPNIPPGARQVFVRTPTNIFVTALPGPTGLYQVGRVSRLVTDPSRTNRYNVATNNSFMITIWYPARALAGQYPAEYVERNLAISGAYPKLYSFARTNALLPLDSGNAECCSYPVILYSHGGVDFRNDNSGKAEELASHGFVVVAPDHTTAFATVFPDGRRLTGTSLDANNASQLQRANTNRLADFKFLLGLLEDWSRNDPLLAGRIDLQNVGAFGWSLGGNPCAQLSLTDSRCKAVAFLSCFFQGVINEVGRGLPAAAMLLFHDDYLSQSDAIAGLESFPALDVFRHTNTNAFLAQISQTRHESFRDLITTDRTGQSDRKAEQITRALLVSFFNRYLKSQNDGLLDNPKAIYPAIFNYHKK
jgi:dienelactone hydrolase